MTRLDVTATIVGRPIVRLGHPVAVEVFLPWGRSTILPIEDVVPLDDDARDLLRPPP